LAAGLAGAAALAAGFFSCACIVQTANSMAAKIQVKFSEKRALRILSAIMGISPS
jgi:hypothetical protein